MLKRLNSKSGEIALVTLSLMAAILTLPVIENVQTGRFKQHGKLIKCKFLNKGEEFCDAMYGPAPEKVVYVYEEIGASTYSGLDSESTK